MTKRLLVLLAAILASSALARIDVQCKVDGLERSVSFMSGRELNAATRTFSYDSFGVYALLWYSQNQVGIHKYTGIATSTPGDFDTRDLERLYAFARSRTFEQVNGASRRRVSIECKSFLGWIDPRLR